MGQDSYFSPASLSLVVTFGVPDGVILLVHMVLIAFGHVRHWGRTSRRTFNFDIEAEAPWGTPRRICSPVS